MMQGQDRFRRYRPYIARGSQHFWKNSIDVVKQRSETKYTHELCSSLEVVESYFHSISLSLLKDPQSKQNHGFAIALI